MSTGVDALYIFNQHNNPILQHVYRSRPPPPSVLLPLYLAYPVPRSPLIYLPNTSPPTLLFSLVHSQLLFLSPASVDTEPLLVLEFLHRITDVLEDFLGAPLLESKIEGAYDVVAQLLGEMCDAGTVSNTEPNALRDLIDVPSWMGKLLGGVGLPGPGLVPAGSGHSSSLQHSGFNAPAPAPQLLWRRANVRHTSNELYVDIIESLSVILAPSGRPLSAFANGSIAFNCKISGVPDLLLTLSSTAGKANIQQLLELPVFHPCVRLARWRERPGELSFVPPDGRFVLAGYEVDLLPSTSSSSSASLHLPVSIEIRTGLGPVGADFEARLTLSNYFPGTISASSAGGLRGSLGSRLGTSSPAFGGSSNQPLLENVVVKIPVPRSVRNMTDLHASRGEAHYSPMDGVVEWRLAAKDTMHLASGSGVTATLRCTVVGQKSTSDDDDDDANDEEVDNTASQPSTSNPYAYHEDEDDNKTAITTTNRTKNPPPSKSSHHHHNNLNRTLMPSAATVSFSVKGWLASGLKVDSLTLNTKASRGLSENVRPYKGVKYLTVSRDGVEVRCS